MSKEINFSGKKVLITGGLGFIGSNLARKLLEVGAEVTIIDSLIPHFGGNMWNVHDIKKDIEVSLLDIRDKGSLNHLVPQKDYIFHLAGQLSHTVSMEDPISDLDINCSGTLNILETVRDTNPNCKIVFTSTRQIYGPPKYLPVDERHPINPVDINGINKYAAELYLLLYNGVYGIPCAILRLTNIYGPGIRIRDGRQTFLGLWFNNILTGTKIGVFGDGKQLRDLIYIDDAVNALLMCALCENANGQVFNLGDTKAMALKDIAALLIEIYGSGSYDIIEFPVERKKIDIGNYYTNYEKLEGYCNWNPLVSVNEGFKRSIEYYLKYKDYYL